MVSVVEIDGQWSAGEGSLGLLWGRRRGGTRVCAAHSDVGWKFAVWLIGWVFVIFDGFCMWGLD